MSVERNVKRGICSQLTDLTALFKDNLFASFCCQTVPSRYKLLFVVIKETADKAVYYITLV